MKSLTLLWKVIAEEYGDWCGISTSADYKTVCARSQNEGPSFFTIVLPTYCQDLQKGLEQEQVGPDLFLNFKKREELPVFLGGFMRLIFERGTGRLLEFPDYDCIEAIRQLTAVFGKIEVPCSEARNTFRVIGLPSERTGIESDDQESAIRSWKGDRFEKNGKLRRDYLAWCQTSGGFSQNLITSLP